MTTHQYDMNTDNDRNAAGTDLLTRIAANGANHRIVLTNACWLPGTGFLRNNGDPQCHVPDGAYVEFTNAQEMVNIIKADGRRTLTYLSSKVRKTVANPIVRKVFGSTWHEAENRNIMQEWALRESFRPAAAPAAAPVAAPAAAPASDLASLMASMSKTEAPAPVAAPETDGLPGVFADILAAANAEKAPVAQATEAQPVAVDKDALVAMAVAHHNMPQSSAQRLTVSVLESILGL